jgi:hypothetical protein
MHRSCQPQILSESQADFDFISARGLIQPSKATGFRRGKIAESGRSAESTLPKSNCPAATRQVLT